METLTEQKAFELGQLSAIAWINENLSKHHQVIRDYILCKIGLALFKNIDLSENDLVKHTARLATVIDKIQVEIIDEINKKIKEGIWKQ